MKRPTIVVVGSYAVGLVMRVVRLPSHGETVLGNDFVAMDGGKGSNQAVACARLGARTFFVSCIGNDAYGDGAIALLEREGVDTTFVRRVDDRPTGVGFILVDENGNNAIAVDLGANRLLSIHDIDRAADVIAQADVLLTQFEIAPETALYAAAIARRAGVRTVLNPAPAVQLPDNGLLSDIDFLTPNLTEAQALCGMEANHAADYGKALQRKGVTTTVVTVGEEGAWIVDGRESALHVPAFPATAIDSTGAGDAFSAALSVTLAEGAVIDDAVSFACAAGAYSVQSVGTVPSFPIRAELTSFSGRSEVTKDRRSTHVEQIS